MPYTDFHYTPTGTGVISGKEVLEQTEDAINDLGGQISGDVQTAIDTANNALNTANSASADAQNAVNTANTAHTAATNAQNTANAAQTTATNAQTAAQNAQNDVNALGNRVTTAENNITQNTTDISGLTTRMGTAEGNITTLQNDVVTAQGTATSAQNTATMARQQSYVFRYSGTAVVPNSTIAYSTIDNTDNIKSGDKILDVDGKLFEITAVDTTNETVTVGSALIDLALDANVVHTSGNETVGGQKTFANNRIIVGRDTDTSSAIQLVNSDVVGGSANGASGLEVYGSSVSTDNKIGGVTVGEYSNNGGSYATIECNRTVSDVKTSNTVRNLIRNDGSKEFSAGIDNDCKLGHPYFRWSEVYATNYYYGSNNIEFSTKFVTSDTAQTITEIKTFTNTIKSKKEIEFTGNRLAYILPEFSASYSGLSLCTYGSNGAVKIGSWKVDDNDNTKHVLDTSLGYLNVTTGSVNSVNIVYLTPKNITDSKLGDSTNKWKEINGLTPSSLSMPSNTGYVDISGYFTNTGDGQTNSYTASVNGWIYLNVVATTLIMQIRDSNDNIIYADMRVRSSDGTIYMTIPIGSGNKLLTQWFTSSSVTVTTARFIPCQGNI